MMGRKEKLLAGAMGLYCSAVTAGFFAGGLQAGAVERMPKPVPPANLATELHHPSPAWSISDTEMLARLIYGEARGCCETEQAAVAWCVLNRVDHPSFPGTVAEVIRQEGQFAGYDPTAPVLLEHYLIAEDVLERYYTDCEGRVLPEEYLFFSGDGTRNTFRTAYIGGTTWDCSSPSPYETEWRTV